MARRPSNEARRLRMTTLVPASCERTFRAWTDPTDIVQWWGRPWGMTVPSAEVDLRVGGRYRIAMRSPLRREVGVVGTYYEIEPPERLVYTLAWQRGGWRSREMLVTVEFADRDGRTKIVLTHEKMSNEAARRFHRAGWRWGLKRLTTLLARERSVLGVLVERAQRITAEHSGVQGAPRRASVSLRYASGVVRVRPDGVGRPVRIVSWRVRQR